MRVVEDNRSSRFGDRFQNYFTKSEREVASILLELCSPVVFSDSDTPIFSVKWGVRKLRTSLFWKQLLKIPPTLSAIKYLPPSPNSEIRSSMSSCLSDDMEKTPQKNKKENLGEFSSKCEGLKRNSFTQPSIFSVLDNLPSDREGFPIPVMQQAVLERQRMFREQRQRRLAIRRSKKLIK